ncbi:MAG TPA: hypothetical protein VGH76_07625 [Actinomycetospora sp.]|jgi:hypothetical protein|uniref:hypothetical protein n=1 Tax=Actinomycetospora sp. TaxID=1872135 RepID=UPI002F3E6DA0
MSHEDLLVQEEIHRAHVLICRSRGLTAEASVRALADQAAGAGVSLHVAALIVLGRNTAEEDLLDHSVSPAV